MKSDSIKLIINRSDLLTYTQQAKLLTVSLIIHVFVYFMQLPFKSSVQEGTYLRLCLNRDKPFLHSPFQFLFI